MTTKINTIIIFFIILIISNIVNAHLEGGKDKEVDGFLVDLGWDPKVPQANQKTVFVVNLFNGTIDEVIEPTSVWIRISSSKDVVFAGTFKPDLGNIAFSFTFPETDVYEITTRFFDDEEIMVETDFDINVEGKTNYSNIIIFVLSLILAIFILKGILFKPK